MNQTKFNFFHFHTHLGTYSFSGGLLGGLKWTLGGPPVHPGPRFQVSVKFETFLDNNLLVPAALSCPSRNGSMLKIAGTNEK